MPKVNAKLRDREWLVSEYVKKMRSAQDIADEVGCNKSTVCRALKRLDIEVRKRTSRYSLLSDEKWLRSKYVDEGLSLNDIAKMTGSTVGNVHAHLVSKGIDTRSIVESLNVKYPNGRLGDNASNWKGGRITANQSGYTYVHSPLHPFATQAGYVMEHRLILEEQIGRYLEPNEEVHHINEDVADNRPENLVLVNRSEHKIMHSLLRRLREEQEVNKKLREVLSDAEDKIAGLHREY